MRKDVTSVDSVLIFGGSGRVGGAVLRTLLVEGVSAIAVVRSRAAADRIYERVGSPHLANLRVITKQHESDDDLADLFEQLHGDPPSQCISALGGWDGPTSVGETTITHWRAVFERNFFAHVAALTLFMRLCGEAATTSLQQPQMMLLEGVSNVESIPHYAPVSAAGAAQRTLIEAQRGESCPIALYQIRVLGNISGEGFDPVQPGEPEVEFSRIAAAIREIMGRRQESVGDVVLIEPSAR